MDANQRNEPNEGSPLFGSAGGGFSDTTNKCLGVAGVVLALTWLVGSYGLVIQTQIEKDKLQRNETCSCAYDPLDRSAVSSQVLTPLISVLLGALICQGARHKNPHHPLVPPVTFYVLSTVCNTLLLAQSAVAVIFAREAKSSTAAILGIFVAVVSFLFLLWFVGITIAAYNLVLEKSELLPDESSYSVDQPQRPARNDKEEQDRESAVMAIGAVLFVPWVAINVGLLVDSGREMEIQSSLTTDGCACKNDTSKIVKANASMVAILMIIFVLRLVLALKFGRRDYPFVASKYAYWLSFVSNMALLAMTVLTILIALSGDTTTRGFAITSATLDVIFLLWFYYITYRAYKTVAMKSRLFGQSWFLPRWMKAQEFHC